MKKDKFNLLKFKCLQKTVEVSYTEPRGDTEDHVSIVGDKFPHPDLVDILLFLKEPLANIYNFLYEDVVDLIHVTGITLVGSGNKKAFIITGTFKTEMGVVSINTPRIPYSSDAFDWIESIVKEGGILDQLKGEIYEYFVHSKCSQLQIDFGEEVKDEDL